MEMDDFFAAFTLYTASREEQSILRPSSAPAQQASARVARLLLDLRDEDDHGPEAANESVGMNAAASRFIGAVRELQVSRFLLCHLVVHTKRNCEVRGPLRHPACQEGSRLGLEGSCLC